jgi:hypothetical protein
MSEQQQNENSNEKKVTHVMQINDTKAGMENIDKDKINSIILKHSQSNLYTLYYQQLKT